MDQIKQAAEYLKKYQENPNKLVLEINDYMDKLIFIPETAPIFEETIKIVAEFLGFKGQRPEQEFGRGPDVLWEVDKMKYFVIECKNGAISPKISKADCNQLGGSINWFMEKYGNTAQCTPIMIHPVNTFEYSAAPHINIKILTKKKLENFKTSFRSFIKAIISSNFEIEKIGDLLTHYNFSCDRFIKTYLSDFKKL